MWSQEKYQREKEKLKQEWEQAQKEVEEEERRYHEEVIFFLFTDLVFSVSQCMVRIFTTIQNITDTTDTIVKFECIYFIFYLNLFT